ncbi:hypothetical protein WBG78_14340 [Chryseolinea sp. T2]|uniref:nSTAND1 domain-containing NTPase n=1 Tax=Chryseolinea sp. T2 TaxID=3129255 RepID=UPI003077DC4E
MITSKNPFKGPRSYEEGDVIYGREEETFELINSIGSNTLTLLYSKSGIGKTSLINASLIPELRQSKRYLPIVFRLGSFINYKTSSSNFSDYLVKEIRRVLLTRYGIVLPEQYVPDSLFELLYLANFHHALEVFPQEGQTSHPLIPVIFLDQLEVIFTLELQGGDLPHLMKELRYVIEGEFPEYLIEFYNPTKDPDDNDMDKFLEIQDGIRGNLKPFRIVFSFREEYLFDFENFSALIPSIRFSASRYRLSPFNRHDALTIILSTSEARINESQANKIIDNLLPKNNGNFRQEEVDPFLLSLVCNQLWHKVTSSEIEVTKNIVDNVIDGYISKVYIKISDQAKKFIESYLVTVDNKRTLFSFELAALWHISSAELNNLIEDEDMRLLNKEMYLDSYHVQILHDRLVPPIALRKKAREATELQQEQERVKLEQELSIREGYEVVLSQERDERRRAEYRQKKKQHRALLVSLAIVTSLFMLAQWVITTQEARNKNEFIKLNNQADLKITDYEYGRSGLFVDTTGTLLLIDAAAKYDSSLRYFDANLSTYQKLVEIYGKLLKANKNYYDSLISLYKKAVTANGRFSVLFPRVITEISQGTKISSRVVLNGLVYQLLALDSAHAVLDDSYYSRRSKDLYNLGYGNLSTVYLGAVRRLKPEDFVLKSWLTADSSRQILQGCLEQYPRSCACMLALGDAYQYDRHFSNAYEIYTKVFNTDSPCKTQAAYSLLRVYEETNDFKSATKVYHYLLSGPDSTNVVFLNNSAWNLVLAGEDVAFAKQLSVKSTTIEPSCRECWDTLAEIYLQLKDYRSAKEASIRAVELHQPQNAARMALIEAGLKY